MISDVPQNSLRIPGPYGIVHVYKKDNEDTIHSFLFLYKCRIYYLISISKQQSNDLLFYIRVL